MTAVAPEVREWMDAAIGGDAEAFGKLYDHYIDTVFRFVFNRVRNQQLAEDLTADTFLKALRRIGSFTWQGRDPGAWLVTIARNTVADHYQSARLRVELPNDMVRHAECVADPAAGPDEATVSVGAAAAAAAAVNRALEHLTHDQAIAVRMRYLDGHTIAETARALGTTEAAVKASAYRATQAMRATVTTSARWS